MQEVALFFGIAKVGIIFKPANFFKENFYFFQILYLRLAKTTPYDSMKYVTTE